MVESFLYGSYRIILECWSGFFIRVKVELVFVFGLEFLVELM